MWPLLAFAAVCVVGSAPFFDKHVPYPGGALLVYTGCLFGGLVVLRRPVGPLRSLLESAWTPVSLIAALAVLDLVVHPAMRAAADASTAPDALIEPTRRLLAGDPPYAAVLPGRVPASPGPGWLLLNLPFTALGGLALLNPAYLAVAAGVLASVSGSRWIRSWFVLLSFACLNFLQKSVEGHDLFAVSFAMVAVTALAWSKRSDPRGLGWLGAVAGLVATARVPFVIHPLLVGLLLWPQRRSALAFLLSALTVLTVCHLGFFAWGRHADLVYQPLHVLERAQAALGPGWLAGFALAWGLAAIWGRRRAAGRLDRWFSFHWVLMFVPFALVGLAELFRADPMALASWEGKNYVTFTLPLLTAAVATQWSREVEGRAAESGGWGSPGTP